MWLGCKWKLWHSTNRVFVYCNCLLGKVLFNIRRERMRKKEQLLNKLSNARFINAVSMLFMSLCCCYLRLENKTYYILDKYCGILILGEFHSVFHHRIFFLVHVCSIIWPFICTDIYLNNPKQYKNILFPSFWTETTCVISVLFFFSTHILHIQPMQSS